MRVTGFALTGGRSSRMGRDKGLLPIGHQTLCEHVGDILSFVSERVFLVGHPERYAHLKYEALPDLHPDLGPLSGLETALALNRGEFNVVVSCDAFNVRPEWLRLLLEEAKRGASCAVMQDANGKLQPLCGVYRSECHLPVARALAERRLRMMDLMTELGAAAVKMDGALLNINTPEEYDRIADAHTSH